MATYTISSGNVDDLIAKIILANSTTQADVIELSPGTYDLNTYSGASGARTTTPFRTPGGASNNINGLPVITQPLTIRGLGSSPADTVITRTGAALYRLLYVISGKQLTLENLTLSNGEPVNLDFSGGGVYNKGTLIVNNCVLGPNNKSNYGGAIRNDGTATINGCEIAGNKAGAGGYGGGIHSEGTSTTILNSVLRNNDGPNGGAIMNAKPAPTMTVQNCIIKNNTGVYGAGIGCTGGSVTVSGCTIHGNRSNGGALFTRNTGSQITAHNNNLFNNRAGSDYAVLAEPGTSINAQQNWWGHAEPPSSIEVNGSVNFSAHKLNPVLSPAYLNWRITPPSNSIRRGPSNDDLLVPFGSLQVPVSVRARAIDEEGATWLGFEHPDRTGVHSWVLSSNAPLPTGYSTSELPDLSTQSNNSWGNVLTITRLPVDTFDATHLCRGFAIVDCAHYSSIPGCPHPGFDLFPPQLQDYTQNTNVRVLAAVEGIVVGMGPAGALSNPAVWGADGVNGVGFNLVVRTEKYFVLYGHLASIDNALYYGARVAAGDTLGKLQPQGNGSDNTHLHLEVRAFTADILSLSPLRCRFGAIKPNVAAAKPRAIDPMTYVSQKGTLFSGGTVNEYHGAQLSSTSGVVTFDYYVVAGREGSCLNVFDGSFSQRDQAPSCELPTPTPCS